MGSMESPRKIVLVLCLSFAAFSCFVCGVFYIYVMTRPKISQDVDKWESVFSSEQNSSLPISVSGVFHLVAVEENFAEYLKQLDIPDIAIALILSSPETLNITIRNISGETEVTSTTTNEWNVVKSVYRFNETFEMEYGAGGMGGIMECICDMPEETIISCRTEERTKLWSFDGDLIFSHAGVENVRTFHNKNIVTRLFYQREEKGVMVKRTEGIRLMSSGGDSSTSEPEVTLPPSLAETLEDESEEVDEWMGDWE